MDAPRSISNIGQHLQTTGVNGFGAGRRFDSDKDRPDQTDKDMQGRKSSQKEKIKSEQEQKEAIQGPENSPEVQGPPQLPVELGKTAPSFVYDPKNPPGLYKGQGRYFEGNA